MKHDAIAKEKQKRNQNKSHSWSAYLIGGCTRGDLPNTSDLELLT